MSKRRKSGKKNSHRRGVGALVNLNASTRIRPTTYTRKCTLYSSSAAGSGVAPAVITIGASSLASTAEWTSALKTLFTEYRILAIKIHITNPAASGISGTIAFGTDRSGVATAPTTNPQVLALDRSKFFNLVSTSPKPVTYMARCNDLEDQLFVPVASAGNNMAVYAAISASTGTPTLYYFAEIWVQLKGAL